MTFLIFFFFNVELVLKIIFVKVRNHISLRFEGLVVIFMTNQYEYGGNRIWVCFEGGGF